MQYGKLDIATVQFVRLLVAHKFTTTHYYCTVSHIVQANNMTSYELLVDSLNVLLVLYGQSYQLPVV